HQEIRLRTRALGVRHPRVHERPDDLDRARARAAADLPVQRVTLARLATAADAAAIARIYNQGIADRVATFETDPRSADDIAGLIEARAARWPTVVVERDGVVIAWAGASEYRPRACYAGVAEFSVYVSRDDRGAGAGPRAMEARLAACA